MGRQKVGSHVYQIQQRLNELDRIGESKHTAKKMYRDVAERVGQPWNPAKAAGIHSVRTKEVYRQSAIAFSNWLKENYPAVKNLADITKEHAQKYLRYEQQRGLSPYTISRNMSAINKLWNMDMTKKEIGLNRRSYRAVTRSRGKRSHDTRYNPENYRQQIAVAQSFGLRRESILGGSYQLKEKSIFRNKADGHLYASVIEKGGRYREAPCLHSREQEMAEMFPNLPERESMGKSEFRQLYDDQGGENLFSHYTNLVDNHAFRGEYAQALYVEYVSEHGESGIMYRGYDEPAIRHVSEALGHSRLSVVVEHYLR